MQAGRDQRLAGLDPAGHAFADPALRAQRHERRGGRIAVPLLQRRLQRPQFVGLHAPAQAMPNRALLIAPVRPSGVSSPTSMITSAGTPLRDAASRIASALVAS